MKSTTQTVTTADKIAMALEAGTKPEKPEKSEKPSTEKPASQGS